MPTQTCDTAEPGYRTTASQAPAAGPVLAVVFVALLAAAASVAALLAFLVAR